MKSRGVAILASILAFFLVALAADEDDGGSSGASTTMPEDAYEYAADNFIWPLLGWRNSITSGYGPRNTGIAGASTFHRGIDIGAPQGTEVYAVAGGKVIQSAYNSVRGNFIEIEHGDGVVCSLYQHLYVRRVAVGDTIRQGDFIGRVGNTGVGSGAHLHFEIRVNGTAYDPMQIYGTEGDDE